METKEKAKELVDTYKPLVTTWDCHWDVRRREDSITSDAKQCALITVNEILIEMSDYFDKYDCTDTLSKIEYWTEVEQEIKTL